MSQALDRRRLLAGACAVMAAGTLPGTTLAAPRRFFSRINRPIGIQLYALGDAPQKDLAGTLSKVAAIGYRDIELPSLLGHTPEEVRQAADSAGLKISSVHVPVAGPFSLASGTQKIADVLGAVGAKQAVVPMFPMPAGLKVLPGEDYPAAIARVIGAQDGTFWKQLGETLNKSASGLKGAGISLGYHNHNVEFLKVGQSTGWDILAASTDPRLVHFEADIGWLVSAGLDPVKFFQRFRGRVRQVHVKDVQSGVVPNTALKTLPTEVGSGIVDWVRVLPAAYAAGVRNFYFEQEPPFAMSRIEAAAKSFNFLSELRA